VQVRECFIKKLLIYLLNVLSIMIKIMCQILIDC